MSEQGAEKDAPEHAPVIYRTGRYGCWGGCVCGWSSHTWTTVSGVHGEFGQHLIDSEMTRDIPTRSDQEQALDELVQLTEDDGLYRDGGQP